MKKRMMAVSTACILCAVSAVVGACAAPAIKQITQITAELRPDFTIVIDGQERVFKNVNGEVVDPVLYNGTTYLPVRAIGELMGKTVYWYEDQKKIELKDEGSTVTDADVIVPSGSNSNTDPNANANPNASPNANANANSGDVKITEEQARAIALQRAGLTDGSNVKFEKIHLDRERGRLVYDVEFYTLNASGWRDMEYSAEIDANTGDVLEWDAERE